MKFNIVLVSAAISTVLMIAGGSLSSPQARQEGSNKGTPVRVTPLREQCDTCGPRNSFETYSGISERERLVVRDLKAWRELWKRIYSLSSPTPPLPAIDFAKEMLVVVSLGSKANGGYGILIDDASERDNGLEIKVRTISPGKSCMTTQALTAPVDIVRLRKSERPVAFVEAEIVHDCK